MIEYVNIMINRTGMFTNFIVVESSNEPCKFKLIMIIKLMIRRLTLACK